jgi:hypothetical protein
MTTKDNSSTANVWTIILGIIVAGVIFKLIAEIIRGSKTEIVSDKGLEALNNPEKKREIDQAFNDSIEKQQRTGIWENPIVDLN